MSHPVRDRFFEAFGHVGMRHPGRVAAVLVVLAFGAGWFVRGDRSGADARTIAADAQLPNTLHQSEVVSTQYSSTPTGNFTDSNGIRARSGNDAHNTDWRVAEYVRSQLERRGYEVNESRRFVPVSTGDGQIKQIEVRERRLRPVGQHVL